MNIKIMIFDTGKGGQFVYDAFIERFPVLDAELVLDSSGLPYSTKTDQEITDSALKIFSSRAINYTHIIIACHTLTQIAIDKLRDKFPAQTIIGFDPGIKKAYDQGHKSICVLATPATLRSNNYKKLKALAPEAEVSEPDCTAWAANIENNKFKKSYMLKTVKDTGATCTVLGCTHYFWYEEFLNQELPDDHLVINPTQAVLNQFEKQLAS